MSITLSGITNTGGATQGAIRFDETDGTVLYIGQAYASAVESEAIWQIQRITFTTPGTDDLDIEWADGNTAYDNIWANRLALSYS